MSTLLDIDGLHPATATTCSANESSRYLWPDKMARTYLWTLAVGAELSLSGYESDSDCDYNHFSFDCHSSVRKIRARFSLELLYEMPETSLSPDNLFIRHSDPSKRRDTQSTPRLHHFASCDTSLRQSLPTSPRNPRPIRSHTATPYPITEIFPSRSIMPHSGALRGAHDDGVKESGLLRPSVALQTGTHTPTIILSPSSPDPSNTSFVSSLSSAPASDYPSAPASTASDGYTSTSSESSRSASSAELSLIEYERVVSHFKRLASENTDAPSRIITEDEFKMVRRMQPDEIVITIDASECFTTLRPRGHGWAVAQTTSLKNSLELHAQFSVGGSNVFLRYRSRSSAQLLYQYCGFYTVMSATSCGFRGRGRFDGKPENPNLFFFKFQSSGRELSSIIDRLATFSESRGNTSTSTSFNGGARRKTSRHRVRMVTVDGVDFEMAPSAVAWDHGSFRELRAGE